MKNIKKHIRDNSTIAEALIFGVGLLLVIFSKTIFREIGVSMIGSAIVVFMTDVFTRRDELESVKQWGLEAVYRTRGVMNGSSDLYFEKAKSVDIIAFGLKSWRDSQQDQIDKLLNRGGEIRIITMKPWCDALKAREIDENAGEGGISHSIEQLIEWAKRENAKGYKGQIEIKYHDHLPLDFMYMMDNRLFTGPYEYGKGSQQTISFEYSNTGAAYEYYKDYFNKLWDDSGFCVDALKD